MVHVRLQVAPKGHVTLQAVAPGPPALQIPQILLFGDVSKKASGQPPVFAWMSDRAALVKPFCPSRSVTGT